MKKSSEYKRTTPAFHSPLLGFHVPSQHGAPIGQWGAHTRLYVELK